MDQDKVKAILEIPAPKNVTELRRFLGMASWYRRFVPSFSSISAPLNQLTKKDIKFKWDEETENAFRSIKECLISAPVLCCPDFSRPFTIQCDASNVGLGAVLSQSYDDGERAIAFISRSLVGRTVSSLHRRGRVLYNH